MIPIETMNLVLFYFYPTVKISLGKELVEMEKFIRAAGEISSNFNSKTRALEEMKKNFGNSP